MISLHKAKSYKFVSAPAMCFIGTNSINTRTGKECYISNRKDWAKANTWSREEEWTNYFGPGYSSIVHSFILTNIYWATIMVLGAKDTAVHKTTSLV